MTFQPPSKSLTVRDYQFITIITLLIIAISTALVYVNLSMPNGGGDFYVHWVGVRAFFSEQIDPYSLEVPTRVQALVYEDKIKTGDEFFILDSPFHILILYFPFTLLSDAQLARAIYTLILQLALFVLIYFSLRLTDWEIPIWFYPCFFIFGIFNFYTFQAILSANPVVLLTLLYAGILISYQLEQDELTGSLIALSVYYWEVGLPFLLLLAYRAYKESRLRVFAGFFMLSAILLAISFLLYPNWILPYLRAGMNNLRLDFGFTIFTALQAILPTFGRTIAWGIITIIIIAYGYEWSSVSEQNERKFYWASCFSLTIAPLLGFRSEMEHLVVLIIPLALIFSVVYARWQLGTFLTVLIMAFLFTIPWLVYILNQSQISQEILYLFPPLFTLVGLYWIRWWAIRPPRVWADLMKN